MEIKMEEIWKDIKGYEGLYQVSNKGQVKSTERFGTKGGILKGCLRSGYRRVILTKFNKPKYYSVHRLVAEAFIPNVENKKTIDHIDTDRLNNSVDNLRWVTDKENVNNPRTLEKMRKREPWNKGVHTGISPLKYFDEKQMENFKETVSKIHSKAVLCVTTGKIYKNAREAEKETGIRYKDISGVCTGRRKSCKGTQWKLV